MGSVLAFAIVGASIPFKSVTLEIEPENANIDSLEYCSSNDKVATIERTDTDIIKNKITLKINPIAEGNCEIFVKTNNGLESNRVTVKIIDNNRIEQERIKAEEKIIALCKSLKANTYINAIGGFELYSKENFQKSSIVLQFLKSAPFEYSQFENQFIPWLSIIDVLMFNSLSEIKGKVLKNYYLVDAN